MTRQVTFDGLNLVARDIQTTLAFYRLLGLDIPEESVWSTASGAHHITAKQNDFGLDLDSEALARVYNSGWRATGTGNRSLIGFRVASRDDVDQCYSELVAAGHRGIQEPWDAFWGARAAIVEDPDGREVGVMSPSTDEHRTAPPDL